MGREPRDTYRGSDWFSRLVNITIRTVSTEKILSLLCFALAKTQIQICNCEKNGVDTLSLYTGTT